MEAVSATIADFLEFLRECELQLKIACANQTDADALTQDLLHTLELDEHTYHEIARLAKELAETRQKRRNAKDLAEVLTPVVECIEANRPFIGALGRLLGDVRKVEKRHENRIYIPRARERNHESKNSGSNG